ncbi:NmrA/HSCARG family protein [Lentiprolixibacter aurantiacus]|uniref:NmrA/HSCARG family protein n=1 Tax=Lentiprolixibacter aurantiacus TaxID=2993939 RepID=A0AAE3MIM1_9FLAO|nr:NmrA/HSCARG family protein [Lentiprolixibacter aurantiacus]MCX2718114.1 NmrA/HSCARG family protein [Lentiprolixibacter aurantiacus]
MENKKRVFVTGITGNQGSALTRHLLDMGHKVIGLTRNVNSEKARNWKKQGVTLVQGDLDYPASFAQEMNQADAIYFFQALQKKKSEIQQAKRFIDALEQEKSNHLVYSSVAGADLKTGIPHFESKNEIEHYIKATGLNHTVLRPVSFFENDLIPQAASSIRKGKFTTPLKRSCKQQLIGVDHIGKIAAQVISQPEKYSGKTLTIATDQYQISDIPKLYAEAMNKPVKYKKLPGLIVRLAMGADLHKMFSYMNKHNFCPTEDINAVRKEFGIEGDYKSWAKQHFGKG